MSRRLSFSTLSLFLFAGCPDKDGDSATDTEPTSASSGGASEGSSGGSTGGGEPVMCGDVLCSAGEICVTPGATCDYTQMPPMFVQGPSTCEVVPDSCEAEDVNCLAAEYCEVDSIFDPTLMDGQLGCPSVPDCF